MDKENFNFCACNQIVKLSDKDSILFIFKRFFIKILLFSVAMFSLFSMIIYNCIYNSANLNPVLFIIILIVFSLLHIVFFVNIYKKNINFIKEITLNINLLQTGLHQLQHNIKPVKLNYTKQNEFGQLCKIYKNLSDKIKERTLENNINNDKRKIIFSGIIHDNKTLLSALLGYAEALHINKNLSIKKREKYIAGIYACAEDLCELNETLSAFNKLSETSVLINPKPVNFNNTIYEIVNPVKDLLPLKRVSISMDLKDNLHINLDKKAFKRILLNLLANTIRYRTKDFSKINLKTYKENNFAVFSYSDDGPGVSEMDIEHLFEAYYRNPESRKKIKGSGLGLAIVAEIIKSHHGIYKAISNNGLTIVLRIPLIEREDNHE